MPLLGYLAQTTEPTGQKRKLSSGTCLALMAIVMSALKTATVWAGLLTLCDALVLTVGHTVASLLRQPNTSI